MNRAEGGVSALIHDYRDYAGARLWLALGLMLLGALAEGFGILVIVPLAAIALGGASGSGVLAHFATAADWLPPGQRFVAVLATFIGAMAARSALIYLRDLELARLQSGYEARLRLRAAATLARRGWAFAAGIGQAGMQALLLTDVPRSALAINQAQLFATAAILLTVQVSLTLFLSPPLAAIAIAILAVGFVVSIRWTRRGVRSGLALVERSEQSTASGFRLHAGLKAALAQGTVPQFLAEYRASLESAKSELVRFATDLASSRQLAAFAASLAAALILFVGVSLLHLPFAVLVATLVLFARMVAPAQLLQQTAQNLAAFAESFGAIGRRLGRLEAPEDETGRAVPLEWRELRLDRAGYRHQSGLGLDGISLTLGRGEWLGVGGASGAGKTTLADLVAGLLASSSGALLVDGRELAGEALGGWRAGLAYVGQEGSVFDDSIRGNLLADGAQADDPALWDALAVAGLADRVRALPDGLDARVGDRGSQLSGGERQRLAIARGLLRKPRLLILDEATAALDLESEGALLEQLRALKPRPAAILIAHRPSTLTHCDSVMSIRHGKAAKSDELRHSDG
jgi:ABC-type multidrug transport system fused ATPase/permease subunit